MGEEERLFGLVALLAVALYLAPAALPMAASTRRWFAIGAIVLVGGGMILALGLWLMGG